MTVYRILFLVSCSFVTCTTRTNASLKADCPHYTNDYEVLLDFPFRTKINPMLNYPTSNMATMDRTNTFVSSLLLIDGNTSIPESLFCLEKLTELTIMNVAFSDGKLKTR